MIVRSNTIPSIQVSYQAPTVKVYVSQPLDVTMTTRPSLKVHSKLVTLELVQR